LFVRTKRLKFVDILVRYWDTYLSTWNVLMHGNPTSNLYGGIKLAACGELGVGVGEEHRGSGEREVLEGFVTRIEGLVDLMVLKFGDPPLLEDAKRSNGNADGQQMSPGSWMGRGDDPEADDGAVFLGTGALSRKSIRDISHWAEDIYKWGPLAYGVLENPTSTRRQKKRKPRTQGKRVLSPGTREQSQRVYGIEPHPESAHSADNDHHEKSTESAKKPIEYVQPSREAMAAKHSSQNPNQSDEQPSDSKAEVAKTSRKGNEKKPVLRRAISAISTESESKKSSKIMQYFKLGYGTHWSLGNSGAAPSSDSSNHIPDNNVKVEALALTPSDAQNEGKEVPETEASLRRAFDDSTGHFLIGLQGNIDNTDDESTDGEGPVLSKRAEDIDAESSNDRLLLRTLTVELEREEDARAEADISIDLSKTETDQLAPKHTSSERTSASKGSFESQDRNKTKKLRVIVYVSRPFVFVFLFELRAESLAWSSLYRNLHQQLSPLMKPLLQSTSFRPSRLEVVTNTSAPIYDLLWDPRMLTVSSTIPNIPDPYMPQGSSQPPWSRIEALSTHMQILNMYVATTKDSREEERERTCKTSRGWWIVWTRVVDMSISPPTLSSGRTDVPPPIAEDSSESTKSSALLSTGKTLNTSTVTPSFMSGPAHPFLTPHGNSNNSVPKYKEIILIRQASDYRSKASPARFVTGPSASTESSWASGPGKLAQGIGVDTKRYIEGLLNLNR
jgi:hypothetical protein